MGIVRFALKFPYTFYALAAFIVFLGALQAVEDKLLLKDEFVLRYDIENPSDGLPAGEGAFLACSFRLVDNCILQGMCTKARAFLSLAFPLRGRRFAFRRERSFERAHVGKLSAGLQPHRSDQLRGQLEPADRAGGEACETTSAVNRHACCRICGQRSKL
jgi:hypothetical protein